MKRALQILCVTAMALAMTLALAACNGSDGSGQGGNKPGKAEVVAFDSAFRSPDGTMFVGIPSTFPFMEVEPAGDASMYWLDVPGTTPVKKADYFAIYGGKLYFTEFIHPTDAAARRTCLYVAEPNGDNPTILVDDVAASTKPVIVGGVLYYLTYRPDEGQQIYTYESDNGGEVKASDAMMCTTVLKSFDLKTGKTATMDLCRTVAAQFLGATADRLFVSMEIRDNSAKCVSLALDFSDAREFTVPGFPVGVNAAGNIIIRAYENDAYVWSILDAEGNVLRSDRTLGYSATFSMSRYLIFDDVDGESVVVVDTLEQADVYRQYRIDDWSISRSYWYFDDQTRTVYFIGRHSLFPGVYQGYGRDEDYSVFMVDDAGRVLRALAYQQLGGIR